jgi:hypothetical protein
VLEPMRKRLTTCAKKGGQEEEFFLAQNRIRAPSCDQWAATGRPLVGGPRPADDQRSPTGRRPAPSLVQTVPFFNILIFFIFFILEV